MCVSCARVHLFLPDQRYDFTYLWRSYECAFSYQVPNSIEDPSVAIVDDRNDAYLVGVLFHAKEHGRSIICLLNCPCLLESFAHNADWKGKDRVFMLFFLPPRCAQKSCSQSNSKEYFLRGGSMPQ